MTKETRSLKDEAPGQELAIELNGQSRQVARGTTIADLLAELGVEPRHVAVERNLEVVPRAKHAEQCVSAGDRIEVVTLVGGG